MSKYESLLEMVLRMDNDKAYTIEPMHRYKSSSVKEKVDLGDIEVSDYGFDEDEEFFNINEDSELRSYSEGDIEELVTDYESEILQDYLDFTN